MLIMLRERDGVVFGIPKGFDEAPSYLSNCCCLSSIRGVGKYQILDSLFGNEGSSNGCSSGLGFVCARTSLVGFSDTRFCSVDHKVYLKRQRDSDSSRFFKRWKSP